MLPRGNSDAPGPYVPDGNRLLYALGFLVGWPILTFLLAERLRNLGKFTFADVAGYRFQQKPIRMFAAAGTLVTVAFYLIAQMVGAGQLIKLLFGLDYWVAVVIVGVLMMVRVMADAVFALMLELAAQQGTAFVLVTHDQQLTARCSRCLTLAHGRLAQT